MGEILSEVAEKNHQFFQDFYQPDPLLFNGTDRNNPEVFSLGPIYLKVTLSSPFYFWV